VSKKFLAAVIVGAAGVATGVALADAQKPNAGPKPMTNAELDAVTAGAVDLKKAGVLVVGKDDSVVVLVPNAASGATPFQKKAPKTDATHPGRIR
jgi:hypothetical protein